MSLKSVLIRIARQVLRQVLETINQMIQRFQNEVIDELTGMITGMDEFWGGSPASEEMKDRLRNCLAGVEATTQDTRNTYTGLIRAEEIMIAADQRAASMTSDLVSQFNQIY